jgi:hypothetical protein
MLASELRIGNYVNYAAEKVIVLQTSIKGRNKWDVELGYFEDSIGFERMITEIQPIPLTEEWLLKFGFYLIEVFDTKIYFIESLKQIEIRVYEDGSIDLGTENEWLTELKHVHQLQNLFFALTGKELEYEKRD